MQNKAALNLNWPAGKDRVSAYVLAVVEVELFENLAQRYIEGLIDDQPHGAILVVLAEIDKGIRKGSAVQLRRGQQKMILQTVRGDLFCRAHTQSIEVMNRELKSLVDFSGVLKSLSGGLFAGCHRVQTARYG